MTIRSTIKVVLLYYANSIPHVDQKVHKLTPSVSIFTAKYHFDLY